jgi:hypothetical protein
VRVFNVRINIGYILSTQRKSYISSSSASSAAWIFIYGGYRVSIVMQALTALN